MGAEFTKARIKAGVPNVEAWRALIGRKDMGVSEGAAQARHPRWVRINALAGLDPMTTAFEDYTKVSLADVCMSSAGEKLLAEDEHIPNLIALPPGTDVTKTSAYRAGSIILQDKASCFSAYLLDPQANKGDIIDACAAPGNKTTHTAALLAEARERFGADSSTAPTVYACERDKGRAQILAKMTKIANPRELAHIECLLGQDFLRLNLQDRKFRNVDALLLDPSCSGSGIVKRGGGATAESLQVTLPGMTPQEDMNKRPSKSSRKRKRKSESPPPVAILPSTADTEEQEDVLEEEDEQSPDSEEALRIRLTNLSAFQLKIVQHAFSFPAAKRVVYSTCSIHAEENENVVVKALRSPIARQRGWRILRREEQVDGMKKWHVRGDLAGTEKILQDEDEDEHKVEDAKTIAEACIRCEKGTTDGTMGFFVVGFVRDERDGSAAEAVSPRRQHGEATAASVDGEDEWSGFDSD